MVTVLLPLMLLIFVIIMSYYHNRFAAVVELWCPSLHCLVMLLHKWGNDGHGLTILLTGRSVNVISNDRNICDHSEKTDR